jgi:hypothetical protein
MQSVFIILLGCNIYSILMNRLETSFNHIELIKKNFKPEFDNSFRLQYEGNFLGISSSYSTLETIFQSKTKITWFLSGGIKFAHPGAKSEASIMKSHIDRFINSKSLSSDMGSNIEWDFVLDDLSTNTAENFIRASDFLNRTTNSYDSVYIVTSDFHYERASMMMRLVDQSREYKWILGDAEEHNSRSMEKVHIQNVYSDITKARMSLR